MVLDLTVRGSHHSVAISTVIADGIGRRTIEAHVLADLAKKRCREEWGDSVHGELERFSSTCPTSISSCMSSIRRSDATT
jgi:hypothetical protein